MKVAILSESPADEAAVRVLAEAVLGRSVELVPIRRGAPGMDGALAAVRPAFLALHYRRQAEALIVVVDSNSSPVHDGPLDRPCPQAAECRLCRIRQSIAEVRASLKPMAGLPPILTAVGLAVPAIEAWYLCGKHSPLSEAAWVRGMGDGKPPYTRARLKELAYGTDRPSLAMETQCAVEHVRRVVRDLDLLERSFPVGFGCLRRDLESWARPSSGP